MEIREVIDKKEWEDFVIGLKPHTFLQSWNWGEFNKLQGNKIWRLGIYENASGFKLHDPGLTGVALVVKISARRGTFLFVPQGPVIKIQNRPSGDSPMAKTKFKIQNDNEKLKNFIDYLKYLAQKEDCGFIRISPIMIRTSENETLFKDLGFRKAPMNMHASELVWILNVSVSEEELLKNTRKTTRYLIRRAQSDGVEIIQSENPNDIERFNKLYEKTVERQRFVPYPKNFLRNEFDAFAGDNQISFFFAKYQDEIISGAMIIFYGDSAFYHQGASSEKYPKIGAPYLLQLEVIREAKARGLRYYNFWGIAPADKPNHPWAGLSLFKKGFGGFSEEYLGAKDLPLKKSYWITYLIEKIRKTKRGL